MTVHGRRRLLSAAVAAAVLAGAAWFLIGRDDGDEAGPASAGVSLPKLREIAATIPHPVYWAGAQPGMSYELTRTEDGRIYIRYLPPGTDVGSSRAAFLTVGTYPQQHAFETLKATARKQDAALIRLSGGGLAFRDTHRPQSVYAAYPSSDYQIEVFRPAADGALRIVKAGKLVPLVRPDSQAASVDRLKKFAASLSHPIYWAGPRGGTTYELTRTKGGRVYIRYLPPGVRVGSASRHLTVGTYPSPNALTDVRARAAKLQATPIKLANGGVAYIDTTHPTSAYIAYRGGDVQVEVFAPNARLTEQLVTGGAIRPVG